MRRIQSEAARDQGIGTGQILRSRVGHELSKSDPSSMIDSTSNEHLLPPVASPVSQDSDSREKTNALVVVRLAGTKTGIGDRDVLLGLEPPVTVLNPWSPVGRKTGLVEPENRVTDPLGAVPWPGDESDHDSQDVEILPEGRGRRKRGRTVRPCDLPALSVP